MLELHAGNVWTYLEGKFPQRLIDDQTSYKVHGRWFAKSYKQAHWDGRKRFRSFDRKKKRYRFPTGFLARVCQTLDEANYRYTLIDERLIDSPESVYALPDGTSLKDGKWSFQAELLDAALMHGRGVIKAATGGGKSELGAGIIASYDVPTVWLTHRLILLHQTRERLSTRLKRPIGIIGDGRIEPEKITVAMVQTLQKRKAAEIEQVLTNAQLVIGDEIHHLESKQWFDAFVRCEAPYRFGLTATACTDGAGLHLVSMTGEIIASIEAPALIERGVLVPPQIWFARVPGENSLPQGLRYQSVYSRGIVHSVPRNQHVLHIARILRSEGRNCISLVRRINHGNLLADMLCQAGVRSEFIHGDVPKEGREEILNSLWSGELDHVVAQSEILGEGVDLPHLQCLINACGTRGGGSKASSVEHELGRGTIQYLGRGLRSAPGKQFFTYVDFLDQSHKMLLEATRERLRTLEEQGYGNWIRYWSERPSLKHVTTQAV